MHGTKTRLSLLASSILLLTACQPAADDGTIAAPLIVAPITQAAPESMEAPIAANDPELINFLGFGTAKFNADEEAVRMAWGRPMTTDDSSEGSSCHYLKPEVAADVKNGIAFMFEEERFVRYDVEDASHMAPGNFKVGDAADDVKAAFAGRIEQTPHKYLNKGFTLTVTPEEESTARLIFEVDANGKVINWRIGIPPNIFYVEGCS